VLLLHRTRKTIQEFGQSTSDELDDYSGLCWQTSALFEGGRSRFQRFNSVDFTGAES
jgi:hypothetical protein